MTQKQINQGWKEFELESVSEIIMGQSPPGESYNSNKKGMPFFQGKAEFTDRYPIVKKWTTSPSKIAEPNSILMSVRAPVGDINICNIKSCIGRGLASIKPSNDIDLEYLSYFLKLNKVKISNLGTGSTFKAIRGNQLKSIKISFPILSDGTPDMEKQKEIVLILKKAERLRGMSVELNELFDEYLRSVFWEMFLKEKQKLEKVKLGETSKVLMGGTPLTSNKEFWEPAEINWMKSGNIKGDIIKMIPQKISKKGLEKSSTSMYPRGTVVIALNGQGKTRGTSAVLDIETCSNQSVAGIILNTEKFLPIYLHYNLKMRYNELRNITGDDSRSGLNLTILRNLEVTIPSMEAQKKFVLMFQRIEELKNKLKKEKRNSDELFDVLTTRAFRGKLI